MVGRIYTLGGFGNANFRTLATKYSREYLFRLRIHIKHVLDTKMIQINYIPYSVEKSDEIPKKAKISFYLKPSASGA